MHAPLKQGALLVEYMYAGLYVTSDTVLQELDLFRGLIQKNSKRTFVSY